MGLVVDTSALVQVEREGADLVSRLGALGREAVVLPAVVYAELQVGVRLAETPRRKRARAARIDALVTRVPIVEFDRTIADRWADIFAELSRSGRMIPANDIAVAATASTLEFDVLLASTGEDHFERVPGLRVSRLPPSDAGDSER